MSARRPRGSQRSEPRPPQQVRIDSIAAGGEGVGRLADGRVVFVHRTAPGELVELRVTERRKSWARGRLLRVLEPAPERREAPCAFYGECGGCTLEHLHYDAQLAAKAGIVRDALARIGGLEVELPEVVASPREFRYRNRVSFALRREGGGRVVAGFRALHDARRIVDMDGRCQLPEEPVAAVWDRVRAAWGRNASTLPSGEELRLTLRANRKGEVSLLVEGGYGPGRPQELIDRVPGLVAVWHQPEASEPVLLAGAPVLTDVWRDEEVDVSGAAFLQVNREAAALLEAHVVETVGPVAGERVVDAYCGVGLYARELARAGAAVVGIELDADAVQAAQRDAPPGAHFLHGSVEARLPKALPAAVAILNPPRAGVAPEVCDALLAEPPQRIVYVSCDPATLARDLRRLSAGYRLRGVRCFDLFPQTAHVETVAALALNTHSSEP